MRVAPALLRAGAAFLVVIAFFCSFVEKFVTVLFESAGFSTSAGANAWEDIGALAGTLTFAAIVTTITAFGLAQLAKQEIAASAGADTGEGKAKAGLGLGIVSTVLACVGLLFYVVVFVVLSGQ